MRTLLIVIAVLFLAGLLFGLVAAFLGTAWAILLATIAVVWLVRTITSGRLDPEKWKKKPGGKDGPGKSA